VPVHLQHLYPQAVGVELVSLSRQSLQVAMDEPGDGGDLVFVVPEVDPDRVLDVVEGDAAVDHHAAHDLIGCQDLAWDVVGASVELGLTPGETDALCTAIEAEGDLAVDRARLRALRPAYLAFHLGRARMAADALGGWPAEARRLTREAERYAEGLRTALAEAAA